VGVSEHFSTDYHLTFRASIGFLHSLSQEKELHRQLVAQVHPNPLDNPTHAPTPTPTPTLTSLPVPYASCPALVVGCSRLLQGMMKMLGTVIHSARTQSAMLTERDVEYIAMALNGITATPACHEAMVSFGIVQVRARRLCVRWGPLHDDR